ncbi:hypothetical protein H0E84_02055 [Luteimonas sp. SJ-92]|uniref:Fibronectin type-III domain-containing protein n=1 Tax=Luteimonas salinisoli TaxID=2752307 RepID=A0A853J8U1_9GAMM|nr:hypothetical protein [Luteimonas salinisoli]NZA25154.1 hypothetical protein [Luteimonas salinisoli]
MGMLVCAPSMAQETVCARVKIEIKQELTLERQAFDAEMRITNSLPVTPLTEVHVEVKVTDEMGVPVAITEDPNDLTAKFFLRQTSRQNIDNTTGSGQVEGGSTATINWMLIPAPGAAGATPFGKRYLVGATLRYRFGTEVHMLDLNPDAITVKPLPLLTLDYFLTRDVIADDPFTPEIEAPEPYTLGVRVKNTGMAAAQEVKIDSAQPRIVENLQGLPITFQIIGSYLQDLPTTNSLLIDFGDIEPGSSKMGRWLMESNLAGTFVDFTATFTHSDELGGALTSLLQATNAHLLVRDVRVDLPGRDFVRDFLAEDGGVLRVYESAGPDSVVTDRSEEATLVASGGGYRLTLPPSQGFLYVRKADPYNGQKVLGPVMRSDAKAMAVENVWLSKTKNPDTQQWQHWFNVFDVNSPGSYDVAFKDPELAPRPPVLQFIPDRVVNEEQQVGFLVEASSPMGRLVALSAGPLPTGATFVDQGEGIGVFDWTPQVGQAGDYLINYLASDGTLSATRSARIRVESLEPPPGPAIPQIVAPLAGAEVASLRPQLQVMTGEAGNDPTVSVHFELYADAALTELLDQATVAENPVSGQATTWQPAEDLNDNRHYYWRARALAAGGINSGWANASFFVNLFNDPPDSFNLTSPAAGANVDTLTPVLSLTNAQDRDGDAITYTFEVFTDTTLIQVHDSVSGVEPDPSGTTSWTVAVPLSDRATYYWRAIAIDEHGAQTMTPLRPFTVVLDNAAPTAPVPVSPVGGADVTTPGTATLTAQNGADADGDPVTHLFEIDTVDSFDSSNRRASGQIPAGSGGTVSWQVGDLVENTRYFWRVKASDGHAESAWAGAEFRMNAQNDPPTTPVVANPGDRAWSSTLYPSFEVHAATDPEGDALRYRFEVYSDSALASLVASATVDGLIWQTTTALPDKTTHYWRVRAEDDAGGVSGWSPTMTLFVSTGTYVAPTISLTRPTRILDARDGSPTIVWEGTGPAIEPTVALYYDAVGSGYAGTKIVDGLRHDAGTHTGNYVWSTTALAPGAYSVYGEIYDDRGVGRAYAPGAVVVPTSPQRGGVIATTPPSMDLNEGDGVAQISVRLETAPTQDVVLPVSVSDLTEVNVAPSEIVFTPANWSVQQSIQVNAIADGVMDGDQPFTLTIGKAVSRDPEYIGVLAAPIEGTVIDQDVNPVPRLSITSYQLVSKLQRGDRFEYRYKPVLTNSGARLRGVAGMVLSAPGYEILRGSARFGAVDQNESVVSINEIVLECACNNNSGYQPQLEWLLEGVE